MAKITTITNPLTGQPAQVDQLDHTAQQIDDGLNIARGVSNPNLLDNWYFGNPVDQRQGHIVKPNTTYYSDNQLTTSAGTTSAYVTAYRYATGTANGVSYASFKLEDSDTAPTYYAAPENVVRGYTGEGYWIDRWKHYDKNTTIIINSDGITLIGVMRQYFSKDIIGKKVTLSILTAAGDLIVWYSMTPSESGLWAYNKNASGIALTGYSDTSGPSILVEHTNIKLTAVKLELGDTQTLAHQENGNWVLNEIPDYGEQLARCQRYLYVVANGDADFHPVGNGMSDDVNQVSIYIPLPVPLRVTPTVISEGQINVRCGTLVNVMFGDLTISGTSRSPAGYSFVLTGLTCSANIPFRMYTRPGAKFMLSAEL